MIICFTKNFKTTKIFTLLFLIQLFLNSFIYSQSQNEFHLLGEFSSTANEVSGEGSTNSSLSKGAFYLTTLNANWNGSNEIFDYNLNLGTKITDDIRNDVKNFSLTNLQARFSNKIHTLNIGDIFGSFSKYSFNSSIKGFQYKYYNENINLNDISFLYGYAYPRWDSLWKDNDTKTIERKVFGGYARYKLFSDFNIKLNIVSSVDSNRVNPTDLLYDSYIYALDLEYIPITGLTINAETAFSDTKESLSEDTPYAKYNGYAYRIEMVASADPSRVEIEYEKVEPKFQSLLGYATSDRERFKIKWRYKLSKLVNINTGFLWYRNNLNGEKDYTTENYKPEISIILNQLFKRSYSRFDISYKINNQKGGNEIFDNYINLGYRDRFGFIDNEINLGYTIYDTKNIRNSKEYTYNTSFSFRKTLNELVLRPSLYLGGWTSNDEINNTLDQTYEYSLGLSIDLPNKNINSNFKLGQNILDKEKGDDTKKTFLNFSFYYKPNFLSVYNHQSALFLRIYYNDYKSSNTSNDFKETSITTGINIGI